MSHNPQMLLANATVLATMDVAANILSDMEELRQGVQYWLFNLFVYFLRRFFTLNCDFLAETDIQWDVTWFSPT